MRIEIPLFPGFDEVDAVGPFEVLGNVPDASVELVCAGEPGLVVGAHGLRVDCPRSLGRPDLVVVPGGGWRNGGGARSAYDDGALAERLRELAASGTIMTSVCTGAMLLAQAGLTDGRPATTHRAVLDDLAAHGADVDRDARVVDDGDLVTCGGVTSGLDLAFRLVEREWGAELAASIGTLMEHDVVGPVRVTQPR